LQHCQAQLNGLQFLPHSSLRESAVHAMYFDAYLVNTVAASIFAEK